MEEMGRSLDSSAVAQAAASEEGREQGAAPVPALGRRIGAAVIDGAVAVALWIVLAFASGGATTSSGSEAETFTMTLTNWWLLLFIVLWMGYHILPETLLGATLGKMATGVRVVDTQGGRASWRGVILRNVLRPVDMFPFMYLSGLVSIAATADRQRLGDLAGRTMVVRT